MTSRFYQITEFYDRYVAHASALGGNRIVYLDEITWLILLPVYLFGKVDALVYCLESAEGWLDQRWQAYSAIPMIYRIDPMPCL